MDFRYPRISIIYSPLYRSRALDLAAKYRTLGAKVATLEEGSFKKLRAFSGRIYYFDRSKKAASIANVLAKDVSKIQEVKPCYLKLSQSDLDFSIYLVAKNGVRDEALKMDKACPKVPLERCSFCSSAVSPQRLARHIRKVHGGKVPKTKARNKAKPVVSNVVPKTHRKRRLFFLPSSQIDQRKAGTLLGHPTISGAPLAGTRIKRLRPKSVQSVCRICGRLQAMYNSAECYTCNPK